MRKCICLILSFFGCLSAESSFVEGRLSGQLGNQMFIIAATTSLALDHGAIPIFPDLLNDLANNIPYNYEHVFCHLNTKSSTVGNNYQEPFFHYHPIEYRENLCIHGYFQSEKYFINHKKEIIELFSPNPGLKKHLEAKFSKILAHRNTVAIHLRYYLDFDPQGKLYIQQRRAYFEKAAALFPDDSLFVVFSDKMEWCKNELQNLRPNMVFIEGQPYDHDLYLMSLCNHNIISNSSFSWWGAYLNKNPEKRVVAPAKWFTLEWGLDEKDVLPTDWIAIKW